MRSVTRCCSSSTWIQPRPVDKVPSALYRSLTSSAIQCADFGRLNRYVPQNELDLILIRRSACGRAEHLTHEVVTMLQIHRESLAGRPVISVGAFGFRLGLGHVRASSGLAVVPRAGAVIDIAGGVFAGVAAGRHSTLSVPYSHGKRPAWLPLCSTYRHYKVRLRQRVHLQRPVPCKVRLLCSDLEYSK